MRQLSLINAMVEPVFPGQFLDSGFCLAEGYYRITRHLNRQ